MNYILVALATLVPLAVLDSVWLGIMRGWYQTRLSHLFATNVVWLPIVLFYTMYALALAYFVVSPAYAFGWPLWKVFLVGAFIGLIAYGTYDFTNHATLRDWPTVVTIVDLGWGVFISGASSLFAILIIKLFS